jgi:hypothetical protein
VADEAQQRFTRGVRILAEQVDGGDRLQQARLVAVLDADR